MAYTNTWSTTVPAGSAAANTIDEAIRQLRLDIQERMNSIVTSWAADPVVLATTGIGAQTGVKLTFSHFLCQPHEDDDDIYYNAEYFESDDNTNYHVFMPIRLPYGCTLTDLDVLVDKHNASAVTCQLRYQQFINTPASQQVATVNATASGATVVAVLHAASHVVGADGYYVQFTNAGSAGSFRVYGAQATINVSGLAGYI